MRRLDVPVLRDGGKTWYARLGATFSATESTWGNTFVPPSWHVVATHCATTSVTTPVVSWDSDDLQFYYARVPLYRCDTATTDAATATCYNALPPTPREALRAQIRSQLAGRFPSSHLPRVNVESPESRARRLLESMIGRERFRKYLARGFVTARGRSGLLYKITPSGMTSYAEDERGGLGKAEYLCVHFRDPGMPPTDRVIMRLLMAEHDEFGLRRVANISRLAHGGATLLAG